MPNILKKTAAQFLTLLGADPIKVAQVVGKTHYGVNGIDKQTMQTFGKGASSVTVFVNTPAEQESWEFTVAGFDKMGNLVKEQVETDENTYNNTEIGATYP